ncbi:MAG: hypothetical protein EB084_17660 [Proteobacteria bacterium]|nr:hypothetical protein [Pseudomonadota bacterium]
MNDKAERTRITNLSVAHKEAIEKGERTRALDSKISCALLCDTASPHWTWAQNSRVSSLRRSGLICAERPRTSR